MTGHAIAAAGAIIAWQTGRTRAALDAAHRTADAYLTAHERAAINVAVWTADTVAGPLAALKAVLR